MAAGAFAFVDSVRAVGVGHKLKCLLCFIIHLPAFRRFGTHIIVTRCRECRVGFSTNFVWVMGVPGNRLNLRRTPITLR
jgi:hypothetical protein